MISKNTFSVSASIAEINLKIHRIIVNSVLHSGEKYILNVICFYANKNYFSNKTAITDEYRYNVLKNKMPKTVAENTLLFDDVYQVRPIYFYYYLLYGYLCILITLLIYMNTGYIYIAPNSM